jgi:hypothetical protein
LPTLEVASYTGLNNRHVDQWYLSKEKHKQSIKPELTSTCSKGKSIVDNIEAVVQRSLIHVFNKGEYYLKRSNSRGHTCYKIIYMKELIYVQVIKGFEKPSSPGRYQSGAIANQAVRMLSTDNVDTLLFSSFTIRADTMSIIRMLLEDRREAILHTAS